MMQLKSANSVAQALRVMVEASSLSNADSSKLTALIQNSQEDSDSEEGAPAAAVYTSASGGIVGTLQDLFDKAEAQLAEARKTETKSSNSFQMQKQSLDDKIKFANKELGEAKKASAATAETQATATGDLDVTKKDLAEDIKTKSTLHQLSPRLH